MRLFLGDIFLADIGIYRSRFFGDLEALAEAGRLVRSCGYGRRLDEVEALERTHLPNTPPENHP